MRNDENSEETEDSGNLRRRSISALSSTAAIVAVDRAVQIGFLVCLARILTPHETGVAAAVGTVVSLLLLLMNGGIPSSLVQIPKLSTVNQAEARGALLMAAIVGFGVAQAVAPFIGEWFENDEVATGFRVAIIVMLVQPVSVVAYASLARRLHARDAALADLLANLGSSAVIILPLALTGAGAWALVWGIVGQLSLRALALCIFARQPLAVKFSLAATVALYRRGFGFLVNGGLSRAHADAPRWIIGRFLPEAFLGFYSRANSLMNYPAGLFAATVDRVIFPAVALVQTDKVRLKSGLLDALGLVALVGMPLTAALVILGPDIIRVVLGPQWGGAIAPFTILGFATYFRLGDRLNWAIMRGVGLPGKLALLQAAFIVLLIGGCVVGAQHGLVGVAVAVVVISGLSYVSVSAVVMKIAGIKPLAWLLAHRHGLACSILTVLVVAPTVRFVHLSGAASHMALATGVAACAAVAAFALVVAPRALIGDVGLRLLKTVRERYGF